MRRGAVYYALITIPTDLWLVMGNGKPVKQKWVSLQTKDYAEAKGRKAAVVDQWAGTFADMRRRRDLSDTDIAIAVYDHYSAKLEEGDKERASRPTKDEIAAAFDKAAAARRANADGAGMFDVINSMAEVEILASKATWAANRRAARLNRLRADLVTGDTRLIEADADKFQRDNGFNVPKGSDKYRELCMKLIRSDIEQLERYAERDRGDYTGKPKDPIIVEPTERPDPIGKPVETILGLFAKYEKANPRNMQADSFKQVRRDIENFNSFVGPRFRPEQIDRATVAAWMDMLYEYPVKATEIAAFKDMTPQEAVAANKDRAEPKPTLSANTIRRYMSSLGGFCRWLKLRSVIADNPVSDMLPEKDRSNARASFTPDAMTALLASPLFTGCAGDSWQDMALPGTHQIRDHRYWVPLVMAYSGARPGEIAQLQLADVREQHGIWIMHITELGEGEKRTKTASSMRVVPIHSELIKLSFVDHCKRMKRAGHKQVFPEVVIPEVGQIIPEFSREMNRTYLPRIGLKKDRAIVVYSLRHTVVDRLRLAGFMDDEIGMLVGHDKPTTTGRYGTEQEGTLKRRAELVEAVQYR